ncbi:MAG TPA: glycosyltransferase family 39 protein [Bryobacteraceae bacterium]|nr:glycosyltransferase family 39 protein [Bryobacteraceae bacterium]
MRQHWQAVAAVFFAGLLVLGATAARPGVSTAYVDPVSRIQAQDEAVYGATSLGMAGVSSNTSGEWLTPRFLGRYALYKPPLFYWLSAICIKILGPIPFALRSPSLLAGAATVALLFVWIFRITASTSSALTGALLLLSSHMFFVLSRTGLMDAVLTLETALAMFALAIDPKLQSRWAFLCFSIASGAALMTKGIAGAYPLLGFAIFCIISGVRPRFARLLQAVAVVAAISLPWHLWQLYQHPRWFWNEYVLTEHVAFGLGTPPQAIAEPQAWFYLKRLVMLDPVLLAAALFGVTRVRPRAAVAWIIVVLIAVVAYAYRNASYLLPIFPPLAVIAASAIPPRRARLVLALVVGLFAIKAFSPGAPWGIPFQPESQNPSQAVLKEYAARHRPNALILVEPDDQFYSAGLSLPRVRYCYLDPRTERRKFPLDFDELGIVITASQFAHFEELRPLYAARLRQWNLDSDEALATTILARSEAEIASLIASHPETDFYVPSIFALSAAAHEMQPGANGRVLLLARAHQ